MATSSTHLRLQADQRNLDDIRNLTLCKVCLRPFYEPFILICGHTFCYGCLRSWFCGDPSGRARKKNCPECRTIIKTLPVPNYSIRDLAHLFLDRPELIPEDETQAEHNKGKLEEARLLSTDRQGKGLFKGIFKSSEIQRVIRDAEDDVDRCPLCSWEIEEGQCNHCGWEDPEQEFSDLDDDAILDLDSDSDRDSEMELGTVEDTINYLYHGSPRGHDGNHRLGLISSETGDSSVDEDEYGTPRPYGGDDDEIDDDDMGDFISDDDDDNPNEIDYDIDRHWARSRLGRTSYHGADNEANHFPELSSQYTDTSHGDENMPFSPIASDDEDPATMTGRVRRNHRILSDEEDNDDDEESAVGAARQSRLSSNDPTGYTSQTAQSVEDDDQHTNYDESDNESQSATPVSAHQQIPKRRAHMVISDDDEEEGEVDQSRGQDEDDSDDEDDSNHQGYDFAPGAIDTSDEETEDGDSDSSQDSSPPQTTAHRLQRLGVHQAARARRSTSNERRPNHNVTNNEPHSRPAQRTGSTSTASRTRGRSIRSAAHSVIRQALQVVWRF